MSIGGPRKRRTRILCFLRNEFLQDPRVFRALTSIASEEYSVKVVCSVPDTSRAWEEIVDGVTIRRHRTFKAGVTLPGLVRWLTGITGDGNGAGWAPGKKERPGILAAASAYLTWGLWLAHLGGSNLLATWRARHERPDIVYANDLHTLPCSWLIARRRQSKLVYDAHEIFAEAFPGLPQGYRRLLWALDRSLARRAHLVIVPSPARARVLRDRLGLGDLPLVIQNCPRLQVVEHSRRPTLPLRLIYQGVYARDRGLEELITAMSLLPNCRLFLRGFGYLEQHLRALVREAGLSDRVVFLQPVPMQDLVTAAAEFDVGVLSNRPSTLDVLYSAPNKVYEYMMAGLALAVSDLPEMRPIVEAHHVGVVFRPDPSSIAEALSRLASDLPAVERMQLNSLRAAKQRFNYEREEERLIKRIDGLVQDSGA